MADYRCPYGYGWCEVPYKDCPHWQGTFCELDVEAEKMDELKPCPFCGGKAVIKAIYKSCGFTIWCQCKNSSCDARTVGYCPNISEENHTLENIEICKNEAVEAWNRRVNDD